MGNWLCCVASPAVLKEDRQIRGDVLQNVIVETKDNEYVKEVKVKDSPFHPNVVEEVVMEQSNQHHRRQGSNQMQHIDSLSELEKLSETDDVEWKNSSVYDNGGQVEFELDSSADESISELFQVSIGINHEECAMKVEEGATSAIDRSKQHQRKSSIQIGPQAKILEVQGAGNPAVNGVYRWFAAHERFVMFTDHGQYQIMGGVNLSDFGDHYHDCWVIEKIMDIVVRLYAVASNEITSIPCDGWICIHGTSPAPKVKGGECKLHEENGYMENEHSDESLFSLPNSNLPKQWVANDLDGFGVVQYVD